MGRGRPAGPPHPEESEISATVPRVAAVIVAAGRGTRLGAEIPKQYIPLGGASALRRSVGAFLAHANVHWVLPVIRAEDRALCDAALAGLGNERLHAAVAGGETRAQSVRRGLEALESVAPDLVLIHDAARPFVPDHVIEAVIAALAEADGACAALPVVDALWMCEGGDAVSPVSRAGMWRAQTPQGFRYGRILAAHRGHDGSGSDDIAVAREAGIAVRLVPGSERNYKITTQADLERARSEVGGSGSTM